jgi:NAD(P)H-hydrate epimerase
MGSVTAEEMRAIEEAAFQRGATAESLMNQAGERLGRAIARQFPSSGTVTAFLGKGHNAGDALVALRVLKDSGWRVEVRPAFPEAAWAELTRKKYDELGSSTPPGDGLDLPRPWVLLDGLLGIGARGPLRGEIAGAAKEMNRLKREAGAWIVAVDLPSGVDPDTGEIHPGAVEADVTFMIGAPKRGLLLAQAIPSTGALAVVPVDGLTCEDTSGQELISPVTFPIARNRRPFDFHKGQAGRVGLLAGSAAYTGAAVLATRGALRGGAGLVTVHVPEEAHAAVAAKAPVEAIVRAFTRPQELLETSYDARVIGPGLGSMTAAFADDLRALLRRSEEPCVVDADALNLLAMTGGIGKLPAHHVLTPHPGEFRRLAPDLAKLPREEAARLFARRHSCVLLLKGARTIVTQGGETLWCNSTGTPGMASGGQGDVLAGVIGALLAGGQSPLEAAALGAWLCGRASERAIFSAGQSEESLLAGDTVEHLGGAFRDWREAAR